MSRPPVFPAEQKMRIVLSILAGEITAADARQFKVSEQSIGTWKRQFMDPPRRGDAGLKVLHLAASRAAPTTGTWRHTGVASRPARARAGAGGRGCGAGRR